MRIIIIILTVGRTQDTLQFPKRVFVAEMAISRSIENEFAKYYIIFYSERIYVRFPVKKRNIFFMFRRVQLFIHMRQSPSIDSLCYYYFHFEWRTIYNILYIVPHIRMGSSCRSFVVLFCSMLTRTLYIAVGRVIKTFYSSMLLSPSPLRTQGPYDPITLGPRVLRGL